MDGGPSAKALLSISALVHSYCQTNSNCIEMDQIREIMRKIEGILGSNCQSTDPAKQQLITLALKAIGNAGVFTGSSNILRKCIQVIKINCYFGGLMIIEYHMVCNWIKYDTKYKNMNILAYYA